MRQDFDQLMETDPEYTEMDLLVTAGRAAVALLDAINRLIEPQRLHRGDPSAVTEACALESEIQDLLDLRRTQRDRACRKQGREDRRTAANVHLSRKGCR